VTSIAAVEEHPLVMLDRDASETEVRAVAEAFRANGLDAEIETQRVLTAGDPTWIVWVLIGLNTFVNLFGAEAGKDAYAGLKRFLGSIRDAHGANEVTVNVGTCRPLPDPGKGNLLVLRTDLPDEALEALIDLDLTGVRDEAHLLWVEDERRWVDVTADGS
jgi:hypothetical protein